MERRTLRIFFLHSQKTGTGCYVDAECFPKAHAGKPVVPGWKKAGRSHKRWDPVEGLDPWGHVLLIFSLFVSLAPDVRLWYLLLLPYHRGQQQIQQGENKISKTVVQKKHLLSPRQVSLSHAHHYQDGMLRSSIIC